MLEKLNENDITEYNKSNKKEYVATVKKMVDITKQYLLQKNNIIETLKETILFPYLLEMEYLVGIFEGSKLTDSPEIILPLFKDNGATKGVTSLMGMVMDEVSITDWNVFRYQIKIKKKNAIINGMDNYEVFNCFLLLQIKESVNYFLFSEYNDKIYDQEITLTMLDKQPKIKKIREIINDTMEES